MGSQSADFVFYTNYSAYKLTKATYIINKKNQHKNSVINMSQISKKDLFFGMTFFSIAYLIILRGMMGSTTVSCFSSNPAPSPTHLKKTENFNQTNYRKTVVLSSEGEIYEYDRNSPIIFVGGVPRSGTTLMRALLDAHNEVRCGEETRVVPRLLQLHDRWMKNEKESNRLQEAGLGSDVLDTALAEYILEVVARHSDASPRLCNKDPFTLKTGTFLKRLFPNSKFIFMIRDGRAAVHSMISRKVTISGYDLKSYRQSLSKWNSTITAMNNQCNELGPNSCLKVYYEQLVLHPRSWMTKILKFLDLPWNENVMHHEKQINQPSGISLSKVEMSTDQVIKPVNLEALSKWVDHIPDDVIRDMSNIAPMLEKLGYDPNANPPNYGTPDDEVVQNTKNVEENIEDWERKGQLVKSLSKNKLK